MGQAAVVGAQTVVDFSPEGQGGFGQFGGFGAEMVVVGAAHHGVVGSSCCEVDVGSKEEVVLRVADGIGREEFQRLVEESDSLFQIRLRLRLPLTDQDAGVVDEGSERAVRSADGDDDVTFGRHRAEVLDVSVQSESICWSWSRVRFQHRFLIFGPSWCGTA